MNFKNKQFWRSFVAYPAAAFVLLQAVDFFIVNYDLPGKFLTFSLILLIGGFLISVSWNWYHGEPGHQNFTNKERALYSIILLLTVSSAVYYWRVTPDSKKASNSVKERLYEKIAILPFSSELGDSLAYISDGIPENIIHRIARSSNLKVLSRKSSFILDESDRNAAGVRDKLGADLFLSGNLERDQKGLILHWELVDAHEDVLIQGNKMNFQVSEVVETENELYRSLLKALPEELKKQQRTEGRTQSNPEAVAHFMKGRSLSYGSTREESEMALEHFRKAIELDPGYAEAYLGIANEKIIQAIFSTATRNEIFDEARTAVQTGLALDPNSSEAYLIDGAIKFYGEFDWEGAAASYQKALSIDPSNSNAMIRYSAYLGAMKQHEKAIALANEAIVLDPISISSLHNLGWVHLMAKNFKESEDAFSEALHLHPNWIWGYVKRSYALMFQDKDLQVKADVKKARELIGDWGSELLEAAIIMINSTIGDENSLQQAADRFFNEVNEDNYSDPFAVSAVYYSLGDYDSAFKWADKCVQEKAPGSYQYNIDVFFKDDFLSDPRLSKLREDLKFPKEDVGN